MTTILNTTSATSYSDVEQTVQIDGRQYLLRLSWDTRLEGWFASIGSEDESIVDFVRVYADSVWIKRVRNVLLPDGLFAFLDLDGDGDPGETELGDRVVMTFDSDIPDVSTTTEELTVT